MFLRRNSAISSSTTSSDPDTTHSECIFQFLQELIPTSESKDSDYEKYRESKVCNSLSHSNSVDRIQTRNILLIFVVCMSTIRFWLSFNSYKKNNKYQAQIQVQGRKIVCLLHPICNFIVFGLFFLRIRSSQVLRSSSYPLFGRACKTKL